MNATLTKFFGAISSPATAPIMIGPSMGSSGEVSVAGEHLASHAVQRRLGQALEAAGRQGDSGPGVVIGLPPGALQVVVEEDQAETAAGAARAACDRDGLHGQAGGERADRELEVQEERVGREIVRRVVGGEGRPRPAGCGGAGRADGAVAEIGSACHAPAAGRCGGTVASSAAWCTTSTCTSGSINERAGVSRRAVRS